MGDQQLLSYCPLISSPIDPLHNHLHDRYLQNLLVAEDDYEVVDVMLWLLCHNFRFMSHYLLGVCPPPSFVPVLLRHGWKKRGEGTNPFMYLQAESTEEFVPADCAVTIPAKPIPFPPLPPKLKGCIEEWKFGEGLLAMYQQVPLVNFKQLRKLVDWDLDEWGVSEERTQVRSRAFDSHFISVQHRFQSCYVSHRYL